MKTQITTNYKYPKCIQHIFLNVEKTSWYNHNNISLFIMRTLKFVNQSGKKITRKIYSNISRFLILLPGNLSIKAASTNPSLMVFKFCSAFIIVKAWSFLQVLTFKQNMQLCVWSTDSLWRFYRLKLWWSFLSFYCFILAFILAFSKQMLINFPWSAWCQLEFLSDKTNKRQINKK